MGRGNYDGGWGGATMMGGGRGNYDGGWGGATMMGDEEVHVLLHVVK